MIDSAAPQTGHILIVDDEKNIRRGLQATLRRSGHTIKTAASGAEALEILPHFPIEVAIVDIQMPGMTGDELLTAVRRQWPHISIIMLTGHGTLATAMAAVKAGAYDYLLKPAPPDLIQETVSAALKTARHRRERDQLLTALRHGLTRLDLPPEASTTVSPPATPIEPQIQIAGIQIDTLAHQVYKDGTAVSLTPSEYKLLLALANHRGRVLDYVTLVQMSLNYEAEAWEAKELIKRHIFALRQKIEASASSPSLILNVRGIGYRIPVS